MLKQTRDIKERASRLVHLLRKNRNKTSNVRTNTRSAVHVLAIDKIDV